VRLPRRSFTAGWHGPRERSSPGRVCAPRVAQLIRYNDDYPGAAPYMWLGVLHRKTTDITNPKCILSGDAVMDEYWSNNPGYGFRWHDDNQPMSNMLYPDCSTRYVLMTRDDRPKKLYWWEGQDYSFNPTLPQRRNYLW
jgi:hypothetical protein